MYLMLSGNIDKLILIIFVVIISISIIYVQESNYTFLITGSSAKQNSHYRKGKKIVSLVTNAKSLHYIHSSIYFDLYKN